MSGKVSSTKWFGLAVQSLLVLARYDEICPSGVLAEKLNAKSPFLRKVLTNLVKSGLVMAKEGRNGGYSLGKPPEEITLVDVYHAVRTDPYAKGFLDVNEECFTSSTHDALVSLRDEMEGWLIEGLSKKTLAELLAASK
ncbi:RrF2 family transcriptional regulator [Metabacillus iocasae]|uniref:Rrf2 family protein n=1 Tax=Priestia iocasae TaxID=2291674 RepID=A0ABS2QZY2_9BACI|nr:Rrf2 family transcriptional regulator [Metabacillus iocasae]MBM7705041.1 Rrf2 family protein [Metabacillus iocasae]